MNADDFVFHARKYGYPYVYRVHTDGGIYHVEAKNNKRGILTWFGEDRTKDGTVCNTFANLLSETAKVQKVVDEVRSH